MLRKWNVTLVVSTFLLSILGTFITRSGMIESVHSFAQSPIGNWFAAFLIVAIVVTAIPRRDAAQGSRGAGGAREHGEPRGRVPVQQRGARRDRVLGALGNAVPDHQRGGARLEDHGGSAVLQHGEHPARAVAARHSRASVRSSRGGARRSRISSDSSRCRFPAGSCSAPRCSRSACGTATRSCRTRSPGSSRQRSARSSSRASALGVACITRRCRWRSSGSSPAIVAATAATSFTSASSVLFAAFAGLAFKKEYDLSLTPGASFSALDPYNRTLDVHEPGRVALRGAEPPGHRGGARGEARRA